jgi:hypothetical protein
MAGNIRNGDKVSWQSQDSRWRYSLMNWGHDPLKK